MTRAPLSAALLLATTLAGCGPPRPILPPPPPHGGVAFALPDGKGFIEVVRRAVDDKAGLSRLSLYFLDAEMKPMTPSPTAAILKGRGRGGLSVDFKPSTDTDPSKAGGLESPDLLDQGAIDGELKATVDRKPIALSISVR
jgi:hypothetical protein